MATQQTELGLSLQANQANPANQANGVPSERKRAVERKAAEPQSPASVVVEDDADGFYVIQEDAVQYLPSDAIPSRTERLARRFSNFTRGTLATVSSWFGRRGLDIGMNLVFSDPTIRREVGEIIQIVKNNQAEVVRPRVQAIVDRIPQETLSVITKEVVTNMILPLINGYIGNAISNVPVVGSVINYSKLVTAALLPEVKAAENRLKQMAKTTVAESEYTKHVVEYISSNIKPVLTDILEYAIYTTQSGLADVPVTRHSILDDTDPFQIGDETTAKNQALIIQEYHRAFATKHFADVMGQNVLEGLGFLKGINIFKYDTEKLAQGLAGDVATAITPRLVADNIAQRIMTHNYTAVSASTKMANAKALAAKMGFALPEPSIAQITSLMQSIAAEQVDNPILALHRLRNNAASYAISKVTQAAQAVTASARTVGNAISTRMSSVSKAFSSLRRTFSSHSGSEENSSYSYEMPTVAKKWFADNDFSKLTRIREIYSQQVKALQKLEQDVMEYSEVVSGVRHPEDVKISSESLQALKAQFESLSLARTKGVFAGIQVENESRLSPIINAGDAHMTRLSGSIEELFASIDLQQNAQGRVAASAAAGISF